MRFKRTHGVQVLVVVGSGEFAFDMLRYDSCCPNDERDSCALGDTHREPRAVVLRRFAPDDRGPTFARWASFHWRVVWYVDAETYSATRESVDKIVAAHLAGKGGPTGG